MKKRSKEGNRNRDGENEGGRQHEEGGGGREREKKVDAVPSA
jgi:hypothetical protein